MYNEIFSKVFRWLFIGLLVTFGVAYLTLVNVINNYNLAVRLFSGGTYWLIAIAEVVIALILGVRIYKMKGSTAKVLYLLYCALTGLTFSTIFIAYELSSIIYVFLATAIILGIFSYFGKNTKIDLTKFGTYLMIALFEIIICALINMFVGGSTFAIIICSISILVFMGFTAYDVQKILSLQGVIEEDNLAIYGALQLYLDFINLFLDILRLFGNSRD